MEQNKLRVPNSDKLKSVQSLCDQSDPYSGFKKSDDDFIKAMKEISAWHIAVSYTHLTLPTKA